MKRFPLSFLGTARRLRHSGFSLIEVTMALGIMSFAGFTIIGVLPIGLTALKASMNQTTESYIVRSITDQAATTDFDSLAATAFFDEEGQPVASADLAYYTATITPSSPSYPGSTNSSTLPTSLSRLDILLVSGPSGSSSKPSARYSALVPNTGK